MTDFRHVQDFAAGPDATPDDVVIWDGDSPYIELIRVMFEVDSPVPAATLQLRDATGGGGAERSDAADASSDLRAGCQRAPLEILPAGSTLVIRRSHRNVAGRIRIVGWVP